VVESQIANLILDFSFGHNLCFKCQNGSCKPILYIYVSIVFQWYKELFNSMSFHLCNRSLKIWESTGTPNSQSEAPLGVWGFISSHFLSLLGFLLAYNLTSPCLGREPKVKVATVYVLFKTCVHKKIRNM
jgi:hypothetical protein